MNFGGFIKIDLDNVACNMQQWQQEELVSCSKQQWQYA
jgi:hypothetical protein